MDIITRYQSNESHACCYYDDMQKLECSLSETYSLGEKITDLEQEDGDILKFSTEVLEHF